MTDYPLIDVGSDPGPEPHRSHLQRAIDKTLDTDRSGYVSEQGVDWTPPDRREAA